MSASSPPDPDAVVPRHAPRPRRATGYAAAVGATAAATLVGWPLYHWFGLENENVLMLYLLGVLWVATRFSRGAAIVASVLGVAAFDLIFVPPHYNFAVSDRQYVVTFLVMLLTSLVISTLTHRVRAAAEEARAAWERAEAEFLRNTLLSGVSHELRTPLAGITGAASALVERADRLPESARAELLETVLDEAERMGRLITNLLDMTRLESGGLALRREWVPIQEIVGSALRHLDRRLRGRNVTVDVPADLPMANVDALAVEQVLANLLDNAVEYTPASVPIEVSARATDDGLAVEVADRGPGLPAGAEGRVFDKFFRATPDGEANPRPPRGVGLGLAICRGIVEAHGGRITAVNRTDGNGGAAFRFTLPAAGAPPMLDSSA